MILIQKMPEVAEVVKEYSLSNSQKDARIKKIDEIKSVLSGKDKRKLLLIGPCSADCEESVLDYMVRLRGISEKYNDKFLFIPRVYTSKPRTIGKGYKGMLHRPNLSEKNDDLIEGVIAVRKMHLHVIQETGSYCVDELLYPDTFAYYADLLAYAAIGARSVENQEHRLISSGMTIPVGMKNPTSGDLTTLLNSIEAAQLKQSLVYNGWAATTEGNPYSHAILRGYTEKNGKMKPNYHYEDICDFFDQYRKRELKNEAVIIDCNHCNSEKRADEQVRIAEDVMNQCRHNEMINGFVKGLMIESYIEDGSQMIGEGVYGKSITDACIGWKKTESLLNDIYSLCI